MSHVVKVSLAITENNMKYLKEAVLDADGEWHGEGSAETFSETVSGKLFTLPGYKYPLCVSNGYLKYDNYNGSWGRPEILEDVIQNFVRKTVTAAALKQGYHQKTVTTDAQGHMVVVLASY